MSAAALRGQRGFIGRGDLLCLLATKACDEVALDDSAGTWFGYVRTARPREDTPDKIVDEAVVSQSEPTAVPISPRSPLQMPYVYAIVQREALPRSNSDAETRAEQPLRPLTENDAKACSETRLVSYEELIPEARLLPALRRALGTTLEGDIDIDRLVGHLARNNLPRQLPRHRWQRWHPDLIVLLDFAPRLQPYRKDMHRLARGLLRHCGRSGVSLRILNNGPLQESTDWLAEQTMAVEPPGSSWKIPRPGTPVLIVSDLGLLMGACSSESGNWRRFVRNLHATQIRPVALVPLGAEQIADSMAHLLPVLRWSPDAQLKPTRGQDKSSVQPAGLDALLAMAAATRRVDPPLLRAMRRLNPHAPLNAGLEGALWCHEDVSTGTSAVVRPERAADHLHRFASELKGLHLRLNALRRYHHAHLRRVLEHEETLLWAAHVDGETREFAGEEIDTARDFMRMIADIQNDSTVTEEEKRRWRLVAEAILKRAENDEELIKNFGGELLALKEALMPYAGAAMLDCWIIHDIPSGEIRLQADPPYERQYSLGGQLSIGSEVTILRIQSPASTKQRMLFRSDLPIVFADRNVRVTVRLKTSREVVTVAPIVRPRGIQGWNCRRDGIYFQMPKLGNHSVKVSGYWPQESELQGFLLHADAVRSKHEGLSVEEAESATGDMGWHVHSSESGPSALTSPGEPDLGFDRFGLYADLLIVTRHGAVIQRFRHIEPGCFVMGSPEGESKRDPHEGPRQLVTLKQGFWLADTACTQGLWKAVIGANPSRFQGNDHLPVEQVSWNDVQEFLKRLGKLLPHCEALLPTEAQWEYACRAGTVTPFSFGLNITPEQVNDDGNHPYAGAEKGTYRGKTVPVKSLPPNAWGLYEMHGSVWEWCADSIRQYKSEAVADPVGPLQDRVSSVLRVPRGGSWSSSTTDARSAFREAVGLSKRYSYVGFRVCLRSIEPETGPHLLGARLKSAPGSRSRSLPPLGLIDRIRGKRKRHG